MRAVIFDFDGVLVDSEPLHYRSLRECLVPEGIVVDEQEYVANYVGYNDRETIRVALERHGRPSSREHVSAVVARKAAEYQALVSEVPFFPGVRALVSGLAARMPLAIASGARHDEIEGIVTTGGLRPYFLAIVGAEDVRNTKPHPEPYLTALRSLRKREPDLLAPECVVIEDSRPGIAAGLAAGMKVLGVAHTHPASYLTAAHHVVPSLAQVTPETLLALF